MNRPVRVYVNAVPVDLPGGGTALDAVRAWDGAAADALRAGARALTDSRGLPVALDLPVFTGAIFRVTGTRARPSDDLTDP